MAAVAAGEASRACWIFATPDLVDQVAGTGVMNGSREVRLYVIDIRTLKGIPRASQGLAVIGAGMAFTGILGHEALIEAAAALNPAYADANQAAVRQVLVALDTVVLPVSDN
jgi:CO/xanthine dehydrogenase FAD-binding subunit